jgi:hypothetical protein
MSNDYRINIIKKCEKNDSVTILIKILVLKQFFILKRLLV